MFALIAGLLRSTGPRSYGRAYWPLHDSLSDFFLIPRGQPLRNWLKGEERCAHIGVHGGLSAAEMIVPLVVALLPESYQ